MQGLNTQDIQRSRRPLIELPNDKLVDCFLIRQDITTQMASYGLSSVSGASDIGTVLSLLGADAIRGYPDLATALGER